MYCTSCGNQVPEKVAYCPTCGAITSYSVSESGVTPYDYTSISPSSDASPKTPPPPPTNYGSPPYEISQQNLYTPPNPYYVPTQLPPPPQPQPQPQRHIKIGLIIGLAILVLLLVGGGIFVLPMLTAKNAPPTNAATPTAALSQSSLTATATLPPTATTSTANTESIPYPPYRGTLVLNDPLQNNSKGYNWQEVNDNSGSCAFTGGTYHVKTLTGGYYYPCTAGNTDFDNFAFEVQMKIMKGDCGAILFRVDRSVKNLYFFRVCQDGSYALFIYKDNTGSNLLSSSNSVINTKLNQSNTVAVVARGSTLDFYINQQHVDNTNDNTFSHGQIALVADGFPNNHPTEVAYSNAKVWKL